VFLVVVDGVAYPLSLFLVLFFLALFSLLFLPLFLRLWSYETIDMYNEHFVARTSGTKSLSIYLSPLKGFYIHYIYTSLTRHTTYPELLTMVVGDYYTSALNVLFPALCSASSFQLCSIYCFRFCSTPFPSSSFFFFDLNFLHRTIH
jgi:hypothetical protein